MLKEQNVPGKKKRSTMIHTKLYPRKAIELQGERKNYKNIYIEIFQHLTHVLRVCRVSDLY